MSRISATEIREDLSSIVNRVAYGGERIILDRRGKGIAAIVSMDDLRRLEDMEESHWAAEADKALADARRKGERPIPFEQVEKGLNAARHKRRPRARNGRQ